MYNSKLSKFCNGCGYPLTLMMLNKVLEKNNAVNNAVLGLDIGCSLLAINSLPINTFQTHHGRVTPAMVGFKRAKTESLCFGLAGDGGAYAIGIQSLLHAAKRDEPISVIVVNNTIYAMTGGQTAPTTLEGQKTSTNPIGSEEEPFMGPELLKDQVQKGAFIARSAVNDPQNMMAYMDKLIETQKNGHFSLLEILSFCPINWKTKGTGTIDKLESLKQTFKLGELT